MRWWIGFSMILYVAGILVGWTIGLLGWRAASAMWAFWVGVVVMLGVGLYLMASKP